MLYEAGSSITALDCSSNMLTAAKEKMPDATLSSGISLTDCPNVYWSKQAIMIM